MQRISNNIKITNESFEYGPTTTCRLEFKLNLKEIENQYFQFTPRFIKNKLSKHIPVVYTIWSFDYSEGVNKCRAKYLLEKYKGTATVMYIDKDYYSDKDNIHEIKQTIKQKKVYKPRKKIGEFADYAYTETMTVVGVAKVHPTDEYDSKVGETVARTKAIKGMCNTVLGVCIEIREMAQALYEDTARTCNEQVKCYYNCVDYIVEMNDMKH